MIDQNKYYLSLRAIPDEIGEARQSPPLMVSLSNHRPESAEESSWRKPEI